jgi:hypothetical protein
MQKRIVPLLAPLTPHRHPNQRTKRCGKATSDRKQSKEEHKESKIDGYMAFSLLFTLTPTVRTVMIKVKITA